MATNGATSEIPSWMTTYLDAWNSHDPSQVLACMSEDAVLDDRAMGERAEGQGAIRDMLLEMFQGFSSDFRLEEGELLVVSGDDWAAEWTMTGTNDQEDRSHGLPNTGRPFRIQGLSIGKLRNGKVAEDRLYWNLADYLGQIGLMPAAPAGATA
jgi:steroid delta-isomerase-like uncharacterized protein